MLLEKKHNCSENTEHKWECRWVQQPPVSHRTHLLSSYLVQHLLYASSVFATGVDKDRRVPVIWQLLDVGGQGQMLDWIPTPWVLPEPEPLKDLRTMALPPRGGSGKNIVLGSDQKGPVFIVRVSWLWSHGHSQKMLFLIWEQKRKGEEWGDIPLGEFLVPSLHPHSHECP